MTSSKKTKKEKSSRTRYKGLEKARRFLKSLKKKEPGFEPRVILEDLRTIKEIHQSK